MSTIGRVRQAEKPAEDRGLCSGWDSLGVRRLDRARPRWDSNVLVTLRRDV